VRRRRVSLLVYSAACSGLASPATPRDNSARIALRDQVGNLTEAIANGALRSSQALAERLVAAEGELAQLLALSARPTGQVIDLPARLAKRVSSLIEGLEMKINRQPDRARCNL